MESTMESFMYLENVSQTETAFFNIDNNKERQNSDIDDQVNRIASEVFSNMLFVVIDSFEELGIEDEEMGKQRMYYA